jgi:hypothetical protein
MHDEPDLNSIYLMKIAEHQADTLPWRFQLDQPDSVRVEVGRSNMKIDLINEVVPDLLQETLIITWMKHTIHVHHNGELLMGIDRLVGEVDSPHHSILTPMLNHKIWQDERLWIDRVVGYCGENFPWDFWGMRRSVAVEELRVEGSGGRAL